MSPTIIFLAIIIGVITFLMIVVIKIKNKIKDILSGF